MIFIDRFFAIRPAEKSVFCLLRKTEIEERVKVGNPGDLLPQKRKSKIPPKRSGEMISFFRCQTQI